MNRTDKRRQVREIDKMMKSIQSLTPTQVKAMNYVTNEKVTAVLVSYQRVVNASLVEHGLNYSEIEKIFNMATDFMKEEDEKSYKLNEELKRSGDIQMAKKKIEKGVLDLINSMLDGGKKKNEIIEETLFKFPNMSKAMIINAYQEAKEKRESEKAVDEIMDIIEEPKKVKKEEKAKRKDPKENKEDKSMGSNLKVLSMTVEGENGQYKVCEKGVELQNKGLTMFFENIEQLENFTEEYKQVFEMVK
ncbi:hypothetical protein LAV35_03715 [Clostridium sporogenes]|uniref:hypothetical protein n=1 Tax=Clostridium sporogenes TaxID=1509 RepID=UPI00223742F8|nr:hypothetical protein [Clostridium sporogenes]MCW6059755.1 hypothetical protein [Clostridium sporogenes]MCW6067292.1 hypothetical protein [Clostridium sporogenes]